MSDGTLWVFGYGSLMWNPGFEFDERVQATLSGFARSFCMYSVHYRGTYEKPGLVLALDRTETASCSGIAFSVAPDRADQTLSYLRERELVASAYTEELVALDLADGRQVRAVTYVVDPKDQLYCGGMPLEEQAGILSTSVGGRGPNAEYLFNTAEHLAELGIEDTDMAWLAEKVRRLRK